MAAMASASACSTFSNTSNCAAAMLQANSARSSNGLRQQFCSYSFRPSLVPCTWSSRRRSAVHLVTATQKQDTPLPDTKVGEELKNDSPSEKRPETVGKPSVESVMRFDGVGPETVNSRLAMLGIAWAAVVEVMTGQSLIDQVTKGSGFVWFLLVTPVLIWATFIPILGRGELPDSRKAALFNAKAERWNGRAAMIGIVSLIITEQLLLKGSPLLGFLHGSPSI